jgi:tetrapyrrole methylase family protein / MazG family protein
MNLHSLLSILDRLLSPTGCPWDREQTLQSLRHTLVEEAYEVVEAIDLNRNSEMEEELGDLLFNIVFLCEIAKREGRFTLEDVIEHISNKLIRRHPHVFGEAKIKTSEELLKQWEAIKKLEKKDNPRESALDGIPKEIPSLTRAYRFAKKFSQNHYSENEISLAGTKEELAGEEIWQLVKKLEKKGIRAEEALRKYLSQMEVQFRNWELNNKIN